MPRMQHPAGQEQGSALVAPLLLLQKDPRAKRRRGLRPHHSDIRCAGLMPGDVFIHTRWSSLI